MKFSNKKTERACDATPKLPSFHFPQITGPPVPPVRNHHRLAAKGPCRNNCSDSQEFIGNSPRTGGAIRFDKFSTGPKVKFSPSHCRLQAPKRPSLNSNSY